jgi:hypothetical protein
MVHWLFKKHLVISLFLLGFFFFPLLWISQHNYPSGDDHFIFFQANTLGTLEATRWWYDHWTGRYASFFLQSLFPEHDAWLAAYKTIPIALFLAGFGCLFSFMRAFFGSSFGTKAVFTLSTCAYIFLISLTPDIAEGFYWLASNMQYVGAVFLSLLLLALYINLRRITNPWARGAVLAFAVVLIAFLAGLNEVSLMLFILTLGSINYFGFMRSGRFPTLGLIFLGFSILFGLIAFLAPGNLVRAGQITNDVHWVRTLASGLVVTPYLLLQLLTSTPLLLASGLYLVFLEANREKLDPLVSTLSQIRWYWVLVLLLGIFTITAVVVFAGVGMTALPDRVKNVYVYSIALAWFLFLTVLFVNLMSARFRFSLEGWAIGLLTVSVVAFVLTGFELRFGGGNAIPPPSRIERAFSALQTRSVYTTAYLDILSGRAARYSWQKREAGTRFKATKDGCVELPPLSDVPPKTLSVPVKYPWTFCPMSVLEGWPSPTP